MAKNKINKWSKDRFCVDCKKPVSCYASRCQGCAYKGSLSCNWNGGKYNHSGYIFQVAKNHPRANKSGYVFEHILVMEGILGRFLTKGENVHHINKIKNDNRPENLELWTTHQPYGMRAADAPMLFSLSAHDMRGM